MSIDKISLHEDVSVDKHKGNDKINQYLATIILQASPHPANNQRKQRLLSKSLLGVG